MKLFYSILFAILPSILFAQSNYQPGYVVKSTGDTVKGYIDYREWDQTPKSFKFSLDKSGSSIQLIGPKDVTCFGINGIEEYVSYSGNISADRNKFPDIPGNLDTTKVQATLFLKVIVQGDYLSLYSQNDEIKTRFFVAESKSLPVELKYHQYYDAEHNTVERAFYRGQIIFYINKYKPGNNQFLEAARNLQFEETSLAKMVSKINEINYSSKRITGKKANVRFFIGAGAKYDKMFFHEPAFQVETNSGSYFYNIKSYSKYISPEINFGLDMFLNPNVQKLIFRTEVSFSTLNGEVNYPMTLSEYGKLKFHQYRFLITPQLLYNIYNKENIKFYIDAGASANIERYSDLNSTSIISGPTLTDSFYNFRVTTPLQIGAVINKKIEVSATYIPYSKFTNFNDFTISNQSYALGFRYFF